MQTYLGFIILDVETAEVIMHIVACPLPLLIDRQLPYGFCQIHAFLRKISELSLHQSLQSSDLVLIGENQSGSWHLEDSSTPGSSEMDAR